MVLAPLQFSGRGLTPDVLGGIQQGQQVVQGQNVLDQQRAAQQATQLAAQQQQQASALAKRGAEGEQIQTGAELAQLFVDRPDLAKQVHASAGAITDFQKNDLAQFGFRLEQATSPEQQQQIIQQRVRDVTERGGNAQDSAALLTASPQRIGQFARTVQLAALNNAERLEIAQGGKKSAGQKEFEALIADFTPEQQKKARLAKAGIVGRAVGSAAQTIAEEGTAEDVGASQATIAERVEFGKKTGASRSKAIDSGFERIGKITTNINNLDRAIKAVEGGAGTGAIERRFPSIKAASVELDQIQGELALDVIGAVTFGALSQGELDLAKQIALPTGLNGPQLIAHLKERQVAQTKLRDYFQEQVDFLDQGGSVAGFLREKKRGSQQPAATEQAAQPATAQPAATPTAPTVLQFDAQGNLVQ